MLYKPLSMFLSFELYCKKNHLTNPYFTSQAEATIVAHVKATQRIIKFMEASDEQDAQASAPAPPAPPAYPPRPAGYYQTSPSDMPQDMSINNLTYNSMNYSSSGSDRMSSSMEMEGYHWVGVGTDWLQLLVWCVAECVVYVGLVLGNLEKRDRIVLR